jgi:polysaccharide export outer membrane protein
MAGLVSLAAGCNTFPRGAGLQSEVLATAAPAAGADAAEAGFAVEAVTRDNLSTFAAWPAVGESDLGWIERVDQPDTRIIAPGDRVTVTIWSTEQNGLLTTPGQRFVTLPEMQVTSSGTVFLPYLGDVRISGMAPETARARIEERYLEVTPSAQVQLHMTEGRQSTVSLVSGVATPGSYPLPDQDFTVLELIAEGGGIPASLNNPQIRLHRGSRVYGTSVARLLAEPRLNTTLVGGDRVVIEADSRYFLSLGAAGREARHLFPQDRVTALDALAIIGGVSDERANAQGILILRRYPEAAVRADGRGPRHARTIFTVDLTSADGLFSAGQFLIRPGDLVYVTESPLIGARTVFGLIGSVFGLVNQVSG